MTLRTVTYDTATHKIVPIECTDDQAEAIAKVVNVCGGIAESIYHSAIAAAPEYQEPLSAIAPDPRMNEPWTDKERSDLRNAVVDIFNWKPNQEPTKDE